MNTFHKEKVSIKSACLLGLSGDFALCAFLDYKASLLEQQQQLQNLHRPSRRIFLRQK